MKAVIAVAAVLLAAIIIGGCNNSMPPKPSLPQVTVTTITIRSADFRIINDVASADYKMVSEMITDEIFAGGLLSADVDLRSSGKVWLPLPNTSYSAGRSTTIDYRYSADNFAVLVKSVPPSAIREAVASVDGYRVRVAVVAGGKGVSKTP